MVIYKYMKGKLENNIETRRRKGSRGLVILLIVLIIAAVGLIISIILVKKTSSENSVQGDEMASLSESISNWLYDSSSEVDIDSVVERLGEILDSSENRSFKK